MALSVGASGKERPRSFFAAVATPGATGYREVTVVAAATNDVTEASNEYAARMSCQYKAQQCTDRSMVEGVNGVSPWASLLLFTSRCSPSRDN